LLYYVNFRFNPKPDDYKTALAEVGLPAGREPYLRQFDQTRIWEKFPFNTSFECCDGLEFSTIFIPGDFSEIDIWVVTRDASNRWTTTQKLMWKRLTGRTVPL